MRQPDLEICIVALQLAQDRLEKLADQLDECPDDAVVDVRFFQKLLKLAFQNPVKK